MKRILLSIATIALVGTLGFAATNAFFNDTKTSAGNTFQAGKLNLEIKSQCSYNGNVSTQGCGVWNFGDTIGKFFNFQDIKPGDYGENTISFRVNNNPAWMCANLNVTDNKGKLGDHLQVFWWVDTNGDNVYQAGEKVLYGGPKTLNAWLALGKGSALPLTFADSYLNWKTWDGIHSGNTTPIPGYDNTDSTIQHLGVAWCFGVLTVDEKNGGYKCDGSGDQNEAQGNTVAADLTFNIEQYRNNQNFLCPEHQPFRVESGMMEFGPLGWAGWSCPTGSHVIGGGHEPANLVVSAEGRAETGAVIDGYTYPVFPHYTFKAGETGWVVHNSNVGQNLTIYAICAPN